MFIILSKSCSAIYKEYKLIHYLLFIIVLFLIHIFFYFMYIFIFKSRIVMDFFCISLTLNS